MTISNLLQSLMKRELPPLSAVYSTLTDEEINEDDYQNVPNIWNTLDAKT